MTGQYKGHEKNNEKMRESVDDNDMKSFSHNLMNNLVNIFRHKKKSMECVERFFVSHKKFSDIYHPSSAKRTTNQPAIMAVCVWLVQ